MSSITSHDKRHMQSIILKKLNASHPRQKRHSFTLKVKLLNWTLFTDFLIISNSFYSILASENAIAKDLQDQLCGNLDEIDTQDSLEQISAIKSVSKVQNNLTMD